MLIERLSSDPAIVAILDRHQVPIVADPGPLLDRFAVPLPLEAPLLAALRLEAGLSVAKISLVTGHSEEKVRTALQKAGIGRR